MCCIFTYFVCVCVLDKCSFFPLAIFQSFSVLRFFPQELLRLLVILRFMSSTSAKLIRIPTGLSAASQAGTVLVLIHSWLRFQLCRSSQTYPPGAGSCCSVTVLQRGGKKSLWKTDEFNQFSRCVENQRRRSDSFNDEKKKIEISCFS